MSLVIIKYILMAATRDKVMWGILLMSIIGICLSIFSGSAAIIEQGQFILAYMAGGLRIIALLGLALFTIFFVRRSFDSRDIEFLLTRPISRLSFILSHFCALSIMALFAGVFISLVISALALHYGTESSILLWCVGVTFEFMIVVNIAFFFAMVLSSPVTAGMAVFGFYILARLMGQLLAIMHKTPNPETIHDHIFNLLGNLVGVISIITPRLDLLTQTSWLIYGGGVLSDWIFVLVQGLVFLSLVAVAAWIDLRRRQF
jgi:ABC-type transport system involved in multi-copper enzyme maturation permease subunit